MANMYRFGTRLQGKRWRSRCFWMLMIVLLFWLAGLTGCSGHKATTSKWGWMLDYRKHTSRMVTDREAALLECLDKANACQAQSPIERQQAVDQVESCLRAKNYTFKHVEGWQRRLTAWGCEIDGDGDDVPDARDQCPDTPAGVKVDEFGCPLDSDQDGVPDYLDDCPDTPMNVKVDIKGCQ